MWKPSKKQQEFLDTPLDVMIVPYLDEVSTFTREQYEYILRRAKMPLDEATLDEIFTYHSPTEIQAGQMKEIRDAAHDLAHCILVHCPNSADKTTAIRKIREAVMTANASIILNGLV